ncbi:MAG: L,D-transpeptidase [Rhodoplanes sp.]
MTHLKSTGNMLVSVSTRAGLRSSAVAWSIIGIGLGAAVALAGASPVEAAYYYNYGYYGSYRAAPAPVARQSRSVAKKKGKKSSDEQAKKESPKPIKGPLTIVVSVGEQRLRVFDSTSLIAESPTSTGTRAFPTPMGVFSIIQKNRYHYSNLYNNAPMPYMQRLTWSGTAMHTGVIPGYPASHGCIRLPNSFASRLWTMTKLGTRVIVARHGLQPAEITHAKLDTLKRKPADTTPMVEGAGGKTAANEGPVTDGFGSPMPNLLSDQFKPTTVILNEPSPVPAAEPFITPGTDPSNTAAPVKPLKPGPVAIFISRKEGKLFVRKGFEPVFDVQVKIENPDVPLGTHVYTATDAKGDGLGLRWMALSLPGESRGEPRGDGKRSKARGEKPVAKPATPAPAAGSSSATEALDRVELPAEAVERLAELLSPGASLIISDKGLGPQTGKGTDFIVLSR